MEGQATEGYKDIRAAALSSLTLLILSRVDLPVCTCPVTFADKHLDIKRTDFIH
jgi:hypothetical protein